MASCYWVVRSSAPFEHTMMSGVDWQHFYHGFRPGKKKACKISDLDQYIKSIRRGKSELDLLRSMMTVYMDDS